MPPRETIVLKVLPYAPWMKYGACRNLPNGIFYPDNDAGNNYASSARAICNSCLHQLDCLNYALDNKIDDGVWGGTTREERRKMQRARRHALRHSRVLAQQAI